MRSRSPSNRSYSPSSTSPTVVAPSTLVSPSPPVTLRNCVGILTVTAMRTDRLHRRSDGNLGLEGVQLRLDLVDVEAAPHGVQRLQPLTRDDEHNALARIDVAALRQLRERRRGDPAGGLREDAGGLRQQADPRAHLF